jgi:hypothetical protein
MRCVSCAGGSLVVWLLAALSLAACGGEATAPAVGQGGAHAAAGLWTLDREGLLESVRKRFAPEGPDTVAREEAQAGRLGLELELRGDGAYGLLSTSLGVKQHIVGRWVAEGRTLRFFRQTVDGKPVEQAQGRAEKPEEATYDADRILLPFEETGLRFALVRR